MLVAQSIKTLARELGFNLVGLSPAEPAPHLQAYFQWIEAKRHGSMGYMARPDRQARRRDLNVILPGAKTIIIVGLDYHTVPLPEIWLNDPHRGRIAAYAWGQDYHAAMEPRLHLLAEELSRSVGAPTHSKVYVDTGAILERSHAYRAGLGFIGKNTMLIHPRRGSDFFLGEILTDAVVDVYDVPTRETHCGTCARCLTACPTEAFPAPYQLDARRCISYLTIEHRGPIDPTLRPRLGNWVFGCDLCQTVCPWNRFAIQTQVAEFFPVDPDRAAPLLTDLLTLDEARFQARFHGSPIHRIGRAQLVRNACIAAGNARLPALRPLLEHLAHTDEALVREHAVWALTQVPA
jgi:epoxyqueuosine reductase